MAEFGFPFTSTFQLFHVYCLLYSFVLYLMHKLMFMIMVIVIIIVDWCI